MDPVDVLALAARHYQILNRLGDRPRNVGDLKIETKIPRSTLDGYIDELAEAGLVEKKKDGRRCVVSITKDGELTLNYINKFCTLIFRPSLNDALQSSINEILDYYRMDHVNPKVEEILSKKLFDLCRSNPEALFSNELQTFFEEYIKKSPIIEIDNMILHYLSNILQNFELQEWFYRKVYPIILSQSVDTEKPDSIRIARIQLMWSIFRLDENKRDEILSTFISVLENECLNQQRELCKYILCSYPVDLKDDIINRLINKDKKEILDQFFPPN